VLVVVFEEAEGDLLGWSDLWSVGRPLWPAVQCGVGPQACLALPVTGVTGVPDGLPSRRPHVCGPQPSANCCCSQGWLQPPS
jgi:hypothetical protein